MDSFLFNHANNLYRYCYRFALWAGLRVNTGYFRSLATFAAPSRSAPLTLLLYQHGQRR